MAKTLISIRLPEADLAELDRLAGTHGLTRTRLLEALIRSFVQEDFFLQRAIIREAVGVRHASE
ncbi:MAG: ribbon-helix-helix protein, CopG family [Phenylobacterium sp.]|uniref:ribbon-helix-helix protein, CopG family n=1 Tax=Phenylobacterium sp. TaxID=1871053 RepID=UPI003919C2E7